MSLERFLHELKRRRVWRVIGVYAVAAWVAIEVAATVFPLVGIEWAATLVLGLAVAGFPVAIGLAWVFDLTPTGVRRTDDLDRVTDSTAAATTPTAEDGRAYRRALGFFGMGVLVALVAFAAYSTIKSPATDPADEDAPIQSIAVLPFVDMSAAGDHEYFSDGVTEELLNRLAQVDGLRVAARTSSFAFKGKNEDIAEIGRQLRVQAVVEGSVRRDGNAVRITAQLIDARTGYHLWSSNYDREVTSIFAIQDEISNAIVDALQVQFNSDPTTATERGTANARAHDFYLRALTQWNRRTDASLREALALFGESVREDSMYARAHAGLAQTYALLPTFGEFPHDEALAAGYAAASRAIALDATLAEAHGALGQIAQNFEWDLVGAERAYERAVTFNPAYATGHQWYAETLLMLGQHDSARAEIARAIERDPLSPAALSVDGYIALVAGDATRALAVYTDLARLSPDFVLGQLNLLLAALAAGEYELALQAAPRAAPTETIGDQMRRSILGVRDSTARADGVGAASALERTMPAIAALFLAALDAPDRAIAALEHAHAERRDGNLPFILLHPLLTRLRSDPRFVDIADDIGVVIAG